MKLGKLLNCHCSWLAAEQARQEAVLKLNVCNHDHVARRLATVATQRTCHINRITAGDPTQSSSSLLKFNTSMNISLKAMLHG